MLTLVTSGSTYAFVTGNLDPNFNAVYATSSKGGDSDGGEGGQEGGGDGDAGGQTTEGVSNNDANANPSSPSISDNTGENGQGQTVTCPDGSTADSTDKCPAESASGTTPVTCPDGAAPDANGNCPSPAPEQNALSTPPYKIGERFTRSQSSQVPDVISTLNPDPPSSKNTGVGQPIQTDKIGNLLGPRSSQLQRTPDSVLTQKPESNIGDLLGSSSSEFQTELPKTTTTQKAPDTLFKGPRSVPGSVPLGNPAIVPAPNEEGARSADDPCLAVSYEECNFPYPTSDDEICRNGIDDDRDGKVDEAYPCSEVPGESKPRPSDGILTPIPGQPLGP